ncbi:MAG: L,D-transpeptidase family protein, partial [Ignavibacteriaceae bacterium]|nr:L,D-transpeptidase family protein [Ignavibacteriaceae bacterium]
SKGSLLESLTQENLIRYLNDIQPKSKRYKDLQTELKHFESYRDSMWQVIPVPIKKIEEGDRDPSMALIINRLITLGFLDTSTVRIKDFNVYDTLLVNSVKHFQRLNGLNDDGVIGKNTIEHLNTTPQDYINKIKLNLERFRWNNYTDTAQYVLVNIPDFRLFIYDKGNEIFTSKVCVGRKRPSSYEKQLERYKKTRHWEDKPEDWQTPITNGELSYLVLNPTWSVPESIIREEIFQKVSKDSNYLIDHNFKVYLDTSEVDPAKITLNDLSAKEIPYKIVQGPGAGNALGKIKFIFPNRFGIYLHDTPTRPPFKYSNRAVSHGCIRVENPMPLAEFLLKDHPKWNIDFLKIEIGQKVEDKLKIAEYKKIRNKLRKDAEDQKTTEVYLSRKVPVFIDYYTAWVDENGEINFRDDVYNLDKILMEYLTTHNLL